MATTFPARLHVLLASQSSRAVVLRKGSANAVCSILWDRATDEFTIGQWLRGRIYERRADLSADGKHMIYFARGGRMNSPTKGSWTAISRAPWLKAIVLHGKGDCWLGGGLFTKTAQERQPGTYWLNGACMHFPLQRSTEMVEDTNFAPQGGRGGECLSVYHPRLLRDGWNLVSKLSEVRFDSCDLFEKPLANGWVLRKLAHAQVGPAEGKSCYWDEHELENSRLGVRIEKPDWEWAERDSVAPGGETIVWAEKGRIYRAAMLAKGLGEPQMVFDANGLRFEAIPAPY
jgi:hypothetical protein